MAYKRKDQNFNEKLCNLADSRLSKRGPVKMNVSAVTRLYRYFGNCVRAVKRVKP